MRVADVRACRVAQWPRITSTIRIEPRVQLEAALVRFSHGKGEWIPSWFRRPTLPPRQVLRPRFETRLIERIGAGTDLENDRVEMELDGLVQDREQLRLLCPAIEIGARWPVDVANSGDPRRAQLARHRPWLRRLEREALSAERLGANRPETGEQQ